MLRYILFACCFCGCLSTDNSLCDNSWSLDKVFDKLSTDENIELAEGVKFVKINGTIENNEVGRSAKDSILMKIKRFFTNYELQVKFSDIFQKKQDMIDTLWRAVNSLNELDEGSPNVFKGKGHGGLGGGKKGGSAILMMATMMGGTMAALGFGALAMLVMKALTVSSMALLLSAVLGLRRLLRRPDDDAGFNRISYIPVHAEHKRRRRSFHELPYRAYLKGKSLSSLK